ncbi:MAG: glycosyltransferase, partial [Sulfurimonas sp.]|nr:glycosyltransferase [Sulfurimonas sp.]
LGIKNSEYQWIAFLDSDDEWHREKLALQVEFHKKNPDILMSYTDERWIRDGVEVKVPKKYQKFGGDIFDKSLSHCIIAPSAALIHKEILNQVQNDGYIFDESLEVCEDYDLWLRVAYKYNIGLCDKKLITKYAGHEDQLSFKHWGMDRFRVKALEKLVETEKKEMVVESLLKKYRVLLKGAVKYDKISEIKEYEEKIKIYESLN